MKSIFGKELEKKTEFVTKLDKFKDLILYLLEDYLFQTKFNDKVKHLNIPTLGINFTVKEQHALDLRGFFNIPQISFDEKGCIYNNGKEGAYISPEFFAKCFIERTINVLMSLSKLYLPKAIIEKEMKGETRKVEIEFDDEEIDNEKSGKEKVEFPHMDFVETYNGFVNLKMINEALSQGLVGIVQDPINDVNSITFLRKLEFAARFQKDVEYVFDKIIKEKYEEELWDFDNDDFWKSDEFKVLEKEHDRLFRNGPFIAPLEEPEYACKGRSYDFGTDEEREDWKKRYEKSKSNFKKEGILKIRESVPQQAFSVSEIQKSLIDYWKKKIYVYNYPRNVGDNPFINKLGLDETNYYAHPADKYMPERIRRKKRSDDWEEDITSDDYDSLYREIPKDYYD